MAEVLHTQKRDERGKHHMRRLRNEGRLPAVLYGHGEDVVSLSLSAEEVAAAFRHGATLFDLRGDLKESAIVQELQWDVFGKEVLHVDFMRVKADERLEVEVAVELRGESPGAREGGVLLHQVHQVEIETIASAIPDKLHVNINNLEMNGSITAGEIEDLPPGAKLLTDAETVIVQCNPPLEEVEEEAPVEGAAEPEVIGKKEEEGEGSED